MNTNENHGHGISLLTELQKVLNALHYRLSIHLFFVECVTRLVIFFFLNNITAVYHAFRVWFYFRFLSTFFFLSLLNERISLKVLN